MRIMKSLRVLVSALAPTYNFRRLHFTFLFSTTICRIQKTSLVHVHTLVAKSSRTLSEKCDSPFAFRCRRLSHTIFPTADFTTHSNARAGVLVGFCRLASEPREKGKKSTKVLDARVGKEAESGENMIQSSMFFEVGWKVDNFSLFFTPLSLSLALHSGEEEEKKLKK